MCNKKGEKGKDDLVANTSLLFLYGLKRYKSKSQAAIPIPFIIIVGSTMMCSMVAGGVVNPTKTDWIQLFINLIFIPVSVIVSITIIKNREDIVKNSEKVDDWWKYNFLDEETKEMQDNTAKWMEWYGFYYYSGMYFSCAMNLFPALKRYIVGKSVDPMNNLMYPCWTPLDLETWWGFILTYMFQFTSMYISYFSFGHTCFYLTTAYVSLGNQARLIGLAIMTADERARKVLEEEDSYPDVSKEGRYEMRLKEEITSCIKHYQKMQRCAKNLARIFRPLPILAFDLGMVVVSLSGIRIATETDKLMLVNSFINTGVTLGNQFIMSFVCELLTAEVEKLRDTVYDTKWRSMPVSCQKYIYTFQMMVEHMPTLVTLTGTKINFENFSKVVNASYCYFSLILSMKNNSLYEQK